MTDGTITASQGVELGPPSKFPLVVVIFLKGFVEFKDSVLTVSDAARFNEFDVATYYVLS